MSITAECRASRYDARPCRGCTRPVPPEVAALREHPAPVEDAEYLLTGDDFGADLCAACAVKVVKALAAVITMRDPEGARELRLFFGVEKKRKS